MSEAPRKTGLKKGKVARGHFSVRDSKDDFTRTRFLVRVLKGIHLLASDIMTEPPTSDPICFGWCGSPLWSTGTEVPPKGYDIEKEWGSVELTVDGGRESNEPSWIKGKLPDGGGRSVDGHFRTTRVVSGTLNPTWDDELEFDVGAIIRREAQKRLWVQIQGEMDEQERQDRILVGLPEVDDAALQNPLKRGDPTNEDYETLEVALDPSDTLRRLMQLSCFVYIRDADPAYQRADGDVVPDDVSYDALGRVILNFGEVIEKARFAHGSLVTNCLAYKVQKMPGMPSMPMGTDLGQLSLGCSLILGNDEAGLAIKQALTPEFVDKKLEAKDFCSQLKKAYKGESLDIKPQIDLTGRRRTNSRSTSPTRQRPGTAGNNPNRASGSDQLLARQRPSTGLAASGNRGRMSMRSSLDLSRLHSSVNKAMQVSKEVAQSAPWHNKAAQRYHNNDNDNIDIVANTKPVSLPVGMAPAVVAESAPSTAVTNSDTEAKVDVLESLGAVGGGDEALPDGLGAPGGGDEALPDSFPAESGEEVTDGTNAFEATGDFDANVNAEDSSNQLEGSMPELTGQDNVKPVNAPTKSSSKDPLPTLSTPLKETKGEPSVASSASAASLANKDKENVVKNNTNASPVSGSGSKIPRGAGSSAVKALRPSEDGRESELQRVLLELKQLTQDSLKDLSGRMAQIEQRMLAGNIANIVASNGDASSYADLSKPKRSAPPPTEATLKIKERKDKREERNKDFKAFQTRSKKEKLQRMELEEANGLPRGSMDGPIIELVHGSKLNNNISAARLGELEEPEPRGSPSRRQNYASQETGDGYAHGMHSHGGGNSQGNLYGTNNAASRATQSLLGTGALPPQQQYLPAVGTPAPVSGMGVPPQPLRLNAAPLPVRAPHFAGPDWSRVDVWLRAGDIVSAYCEVLDRGSPEDFGRLLTEGGIHPYALSASILNRVCDMVSLVLLQGAGPHTETCLLFILAVLRDTRVADKPSSATVLLGRTKHALSEALTLLSSKAHQLPTKQALLAGLLQKQLGRI